ncbi:hypothetical protein OKW45_000044 [Paraburkholderia sp. WSM4175]
MRDLQALSTRACEGDRDTTAERVRLTSLS